MIISRKQLAEALGLSTRTLDRLAHQSSDFPKKVRLSAKRVGYRVADVDRYLDAQVAA